MSTPLSQHARSPHSPSPIYGVSPGFTVGDLDRAYTPSIPVLYGSLVTYPGGSLQPNWDHGTVATQLTTTTTSAAINTNARAVKIAVNVSGSGSITLAAYTAADSYTTPIAIYNNLTAGGYQFYLGGYGNKAEFSSPTNESQTDDPSNITNPNIETSQPGINAAGTTASPTSDGTSYIGGLSQYGPLGAISEKSNTFSQNPGGLDPAQSNVAGLSPSTDNNFFGQTYNPFQFLSLDGWAMKFTATVTGTVGYDVEVMPIS